MTDNMAERTSGAGAARKQRTGNRTTRARPFSNRTKEFLVPIEMLRQLAQHPLPVTVESSADVDKIRVLRAAGLVMALFMKKTPQADYKEALSARVFAITAQGRAALANPDPPGGDGG